MQTDVIGKVRNTRLGTSKPLLPLFEAIVNSIQAIEERPDKAKGRIVVRILRDETEVTLPFRDGTERPVSGFVVEDNGVGFTDENYESFNTSETTHKSVKGGKGIGRFSWLKAFDQVRITSNYRQADGWWRRSFTFRLTPEGVEGLVREPSGQHDWATAVALSGIRSEYLKYCPKRAHTIAFRIVEHCLSYFLHEDCANVTLIDGDESIDLNAVHADTQRIIADSNIKVGEEGFRVVALKVRASDEQSHRLHFCADKREVTTEQIASHMPDLAMRLTDEDGGYFVSVFVYGKYLDANVSPERQDFVFSRGPEEQIDMYQLGIRDIRDGVLKELGKVLEPLLGPIKEQKEEHVRAYVEDRAPQYRAVLKHSPQVLDRLPPDASDERIDTELYKAKRDLEQEVRTFSVLNTRDAGSELYKKFVEKVTDLTQADLVSYVLHRRIILEELERALSSTNNEYEREAAVHKLIYPMRVTSENAIADEQQNLWIVDERLVYHRFLASDVELYKILEGSESERRPDILVFNRPIAVSEASSPVNSVVVLEFKRPMRKTYSDEDKDNPIIQVLDYATEIRAAGRVVSSKGRPVTISPSAPFYAYIICDITSRIERFCTIASYRKTPDGLGYYGYNDGLRTYVEVISYEKLLDDAKKRNRAFFDRLGVPLL